MKVDKVKKPKQKTQGSLGKVSTDLGSIFIFLSFFIEDIFIYFVVFLPMCGCYNFYLFPQYFHFRHPIIFVLSLFQFFFKTLTLLFITIFYFLIFLFSTFFFTPSVPDRRGLYGNLGGTGAAGARGWDSGYPYRTDSSGFPYDSTRPGTSGPRGKEIYNYLLC